MKLSRLLILLAVVLIVVVLLVYAYQSETAPVVATSWQQGPSYPLSVNGVYAVGGQQCVNESSYVYCVGGWDVNMAPRDNVYSASLTSSGNLSAWTSDSESYPVNINGESCIAASGYIFCVGGQYNDQMDDIASSYFAPLASGQVGGWESSTAYPIPIDSQSCVTSSGYIYCVGGSNETDGTNADSALSSSAWYATVSSSGIGHWNETTPYPPDVYLESCAASGGYVYCVGGADSGNNAVSTDYYAQLTSAGIGAWSLTTSYPQQASGQACATSAGYIYCVGGLGSPNSYTNAAYYAPVNSGGVGKWTRAGDYPTGVETACTIESGVMYCVGGLNSSSAGMTAETYYAELSDF
ncbi:MAG TPA: hypothetical protein VEJ36_06325 [Nitrososphaerales archaeon]|nr:hypothetical protein [Nitrososphaerales archaeon]